MYFISRCVCSRSSKNLFVKIVHPGGRVEIHDRPIMAAEVLSRHPKCCVAHPDVFRQPYAVVSASATLALGHKYYVVPLRTIRRLQLKQSCAKRQLPDHQSNNKLEEMETKKKNNGSNNSSGLGVQNGGTRLSVAHFYQWHPALESIQEE